MAHDALMLYSCTHVATVGFTGLMSVNKSDFLAARPMLLLTCITGICPLALWYCGPSQQSCPSCVVLK